jgi:hypothetical protein
VVVYEEENLLPLACLSLLYQMVNTQSTSDIKSAESSREFSRHSIRRRTTSHPASYCRAEVERFPSRPRLNVENLLIKSSGTWEGGCDAQSRLNVLHSQQSSTLSKREESC